MRKAMLLQKERVKTRTRRWDEENPVNDVHTRMPENKGERGLDAAALKSDLQRPGLRLRSFHERSSSNSGLSAKRAGQTFGAPLLVTMMPGQQSRDEPSP